MAAYCTRAQIEAQFGTENVKQWADLDSREDATAITARITAAIADASEMILGRLRCGPYDSDTFTTTEPTLRRVCVLLAAVELYESRGVNDFDPASGRAVHKLMWQKKAAEQLLRDILGGKLQLDTTIVDRVSHAQTAPHIVEE